MLRSAVILGAVLGCLACCAEEEIKAEEFEAVVVFVNYLSRYEGSAQRVDGDARWVGRLRKNDGLEISYAIHSLTITLGESADRSRQDISLSRNDSKNRR